MINLNSEYLIESGLLHYEQIIQRNIKRYQKKLIGFHLYKSRIQAKLKFWQAMDEYFKYNDLLNFYESKSKYPNAAEIITFLSRELQKAFDFATDQANNPISISKIFAGGRFFGSEHTLLDVRSLNIPNPFNTRYNHAKGLLNFETIIEDNIKYYSKKLNNSSRFNLYKNRIQAKYHYWQKLHHYLNTHDTSRLLIQNQLKKSYDNLRDFMNLAHISVINDMSQEERALIYKGGSIFGSNKTIQDMQRLSIFDGKKYTGQGRYRLGISFFGLLGNGRYVHPFPIEYRKRYVSDDLKSSPPKLYAKFGGEV